MLHRGKIVENQIRILKYSISDLASKLGIGRNTLYSRFKDDKLPLDFILDVGKIINYDFSGDIPEFANSSPNVPNDEHKDVRTESSNYQWERQEANDLEAENERLRLKLKKAIQANRHLLNKYTALSIRYNGMADKYQAQLEKKSLEYELASSGKNDPYRMTLLQELQDLRERYFETTNKYIKILEELRQAQRFNVDDFLPR